MNRDDITRMAREAGFVGFDGENGSLRRFAALVAAAEREACAQLADAECNRSDPLAPVTQFDSGAYSVAGYLASAIRARGKA